MTTPSDAQMRRSQLARWHIAHQAIIETRFGLQVVARYPNERPGGLGLCDLSLLPRTGLKGVGATDFLSTRVSMLPQMPNNAVLIDDGSIVARLSHEEYLILGALNFEPQFVSDIDAAIGSVGDKAAYPLPRADSHCLFALIGTAAEEAMAKLCAVDMRASKFPPGSIAQTSVARVNGIFIAHAFGSQAGFFILCESASAEYLWGSIIDAIDEYGGGPIGLQSIRTRERS